MRSPRLCPTLICLFSLVALAHGQNVQPGLYENTTEVTWQQSPFPPGMNMPQSSMGEGKHTTEVCVTQAQIDRYGPIVPERWGQGCHLTNIVKSAGGMHAELVCKGEVEGQGSFDAVWGPESGGGQLHFLGQMVTREFTAPIEFTSKLVSVYKGRNCGNVKPSPTQED